MIKLIVDYQKALDAIYDHVGFVEDWVICPLDDQTDCYWYANDEFVRWSETLEKFNSNGDYYQDQIYTQRFYSKWIYEGADFTMIFCNPGVDGMKWFRLFDNTKRIKDLEVAKRKIN